MTDQIHMRETKGIQKTIAYTCAAVNYLPKVRKLFASIRAYHPEFELVLALADELPSVVALNEPTIDRVLTSYDFGIRDVRQWIFFHDVVELSTAIKPFALQTLLAEEGVARVVYFDPDMILFSRIDDILEELDTNNIALTPHQVVPELTVEAIRDNEIGSLKHGVFNLGFIAVSNTNESKRFADWWADRLYHFCVADVANGLFTDQKWINFAPIYFEGVHILKSPRFNVATWNLTTRKITGDLDNGLAVNGEPLGFYHFTGFDSGAHRVMAIKNGADSPAVLDLIRWYEEQTRDDANDPLSRLPWGYANYEGGGKISKEARRLYRAREDLRRAFPDPFSTLLNENFKRWHEREFGVSVVSNGQSKSLGSSVSISSGLRRVARATARYAAEPTYRAEIHRTLKRIFQQEGLSALLRFFFIRR